MFTLNRKGDLLVFLAEMYDSGQHCSAATVAYEVLIILSARHFNSSMLVTVRNCIHLPLFMFV